MRIVSFYEPVCGLSGVDLRAALIQNKLLSEDELAADDERLQQRSTKSRRRREM